MWEEPTTLSFPVAHITAPRCPAVASFGPFSLNSKVARPAQRTVGSLCHDATGLHVSLMAEDKHIFSPWHDCNDHVFSKSDVLEAFITPVTNIFDSPQQYYELDTSPTGALFGALVGNRLGNSSTAVANPSIIGNRTCDPPARSLSLSSSSTIHDCAIRCSGAAKFPEGLTASATVAQGGYTVELLVPWALFDVRHDPGLEPTTSGPPIPLFRPHLPLTSLPSSRAVGSAHSSPDPRRGRRGG